MFKNEYDVLVVGAGHAGVEAALASARLNKKTALVNLYEDRIAAMPYKLLFHDQEVDGVILSDGTVIKAKAVILTTGTYLKSDILMGTNRHSSGPNEEKTTTGISESLKTLGLTLMRFKTGTPPRIYKDSVDLNPMQLSPSLELKTVKNLFTAGQINGTSGYEEAAGQGLMAGINAVRKIDNKEPLILRRDEAYIGVMIDDLINKEHRLLLRNDNAEIRLKNYGHEIGLISNEEYNQYKVYLTEINDAITALNNIRFTPKSELAIILKEKEQADLTHGYSGIEILKIPTVQIEELIPFVKELEKLSHNQLQSIMIETRFEGYVKKEYQQVEKLVKLERKKIPTDINYFMVENLATEARQKLEKIRPLNIGQASRITGFKIEWEKLMSKKKTTTSFKYEHEKEIIDLSTSKLSLKEVGISNRAKAIEENGTSIINYVQEHKAYQSNIELHKIIQNKFLVLNQKVEVGKINFIDLKDKLEFVEQSDLTKGDLIFLNKVDQSTLTGEAKLISKTINNKKTNLLELENILFSQTVISEGNCFAVVIHTGTKNYSSSIINFAEEEDESDFEKAMSKITKILVVSILTMIPIIFVVAGLRTEN
ncbi:hypothetical protein FQA39_LY13034 [Lamprigera yunnana]|nr:hypothetical protein FQA39_LY13034 [Lamprigera yunnana]